MEAADENLQPPGAEFPGQVGRPRKLVGLHAGQGDNGPGAGQAVRPDDAPHGDLLDRVVEQLHLDVDVPEQAPPGDVAGEAGQAGQGVARQHPPEMPNDVALVVVLRRLDEDDAEGFARGPGRSEKTSGHLPHPAQNNTR